MVANATKTVGGRMQTTLVNLTLEAEEAMLVDQPAQMSGDYECEIADGSKPVIGFVIAANVKRNYVTGEYPVADVPGTVTVATAFLEVRPITVGATPVVSGTRVGINSAGLLAPAGVGVATVGVALMSGSTPAKVDVGIGPVGPFGA
jgi:hypothetical protein